MAVKHLRSGMDFAKSLFKALGGLKIFDFGEKEKMGPAKMGQGLPQDSPGQKVIVSKPDVRVDEKDIEISTEAKVLVSVV